MATPKVDTSTTSYKKGTVCKNVMQQSFFNTVAKYQPCEIIYTDGSKAAEGVGCAIATDNTCRKWGLNPICSIFFAELYAIFQGLCYIKEQHVGRYLICSDSLSALSAIQNKFASDPLLIRIHILHNQLHQENKQIIFIWCPGHTGLRGNEIADQAARHSIMSDVTDVPLRLEDAKAALKQNVFQLWQEEWSSSDQSLKLFKPTIKKWSLPSLTRREGTSSTYQNKNRSHIPYTLTSFTGEPSTNM
nr:unnamed protein product [Callosobruchus analis]